MKKLILITIFLMFQPLKSFGSEDWIKSGVSIDGSTFYYKNIKKFDGYVYVERMLDYLKPGKSGVMCIWDIVQIDCSNYSWKYVNFQSYLRPLCKGKGMYDQKVILKSMSKQKFRYNEPGQIDYNISKVSCNKFK